MTKYLNTSLLILTFILLISVYNSNTLNNSLKIPGGYLLNSLGVIHKNGLSSIITQDYKKATKWFTLAAEAGNSDAQNNLGTLYTLGHGVEKDFTKAAHWYQLAADQGNAKAQNNLAGIYILGQCSATITLSGRRQLS